MQLSKLLIILLMSLTSTANIYAEETNPVVFVESNNADCATDDSKMISIKNTGNQPLEVWLDRWFMDVQTGDHTKHILKSDDNTHDLGCSVTRRAKNNIGLFIALNR